MSQFKLFATFLGCAMVSSCSVYPKKGKNDGGEAPIAAIDASRLLLDGVMFSPCKINVTFRGSSREIHFATEDGLNLSTAKWVYLNSETCEGQRDITIGSKSRVNDQGTSPSIADAHNILIEPVDEYTFSPKTDAGRDEILKNYPNENMALDASFKTSELKLGEVKVPIYTVAKKVGSKHCFGQLEEGKDGKTVETRMTMVTEQDDSCIFWPKVF